MVSNTDIQQALVLSQSSYETTSRKLVDSLKGTGWNALDNKDLGMSAFKFGRGLGDTNFLYDNLNDQGFVAEKGDTLAVVFTGSATSTILLDRLEIQDWLTNAGAGFLGWRGVANRYDELFDSAIDYAKTNSRIDKVMVAGHSRGGAMAEYHYVNYSDAVKSSGLEMVGVSFASPGLKLNRNVDEAGFIAFEDVQDPVVDSVLSDVNNVTEIGLDGPKTGRASSHSLDNNYAPEVKDWLRLGPSDVALSAQKVVENASVGTSVGDVSGKDPNPGDVLTYSLVDDADGRFALNGKKLVVNGPVNFEESSSHDIKVQAKDGAGATLTKTFRIDVADRDERFPSVAEARALDEADVNGVINQAFLTGDGTKTFRVSLDADTAMAAQSNTLGVYEVTAAGEIVDTRILFNDTNFDNATQATVSGVEAGHKLGFFIVQNGADWAGALTDSDTFQFTDTANGGNATVSSGANMSLAVNDADTGLTVFHTIDETLNPDGLTHVISGEREDGSALIFGMEDLLNGGDMDFQDTVFTVEQVDFV